MILHITNDYSGSKVYKNLVEKLDDFKVRQLVYTAVRSENRINKNKANFNNKKSEIIYSNILTLYSRFNFFHKKSKILADLEGKVDFNKHKSRIITHAHTLYSDGAIAYELFLKYNIPYVVTIRSTDVNIFLKYLKFLNPLAIKILLNAKKIIFISKVNKEKVLANKIFNKYRKILLAKTEIVPNSLDDFWYKKRVSNTIKKIDYKNISLLYVGTFIKRKGLLELIEAVKKLNIETNYKYVLNIVGSGKNEAKVKTLIKGDKSFIFHGKILDQNILRQQFLNSNIFVMPSKIETFGLVYIEAISQGVPVIYSKNESIDGLFLEKVGESVQALNVNSIMKGILTITKNYESINFNPTIILKDFSWEESAKKHYNIYLKSKNENTIHTSIF